MSLLICSGCDASNHGWDAEKWQIELEAHQTRYPHPFAKIPEFLQKFCWPKLGLREFFHKFSKIRENPISKE